MTSPTNRTENAHRRRILETSYQSIIAAAFRLKRRYRTSFADVDLTIDDLGQYGALKAIECYDRFVSEDRAAVLGMPDLALKRCIVGFAMRCMACHIIDVYRMRDRRREAVAPELLISTINSAEVDRLKLWERLQPIMRQISPRQRAIVSSLWNGLNTEDIGQELRLTANVVQKDIAAVRRVAA